MFKVLKVLFGLITFIILALLAAPFFIDVNDYKPEISKVVYDATGRNVNIEHIQLSAFPWVGLTLKNVQLENASGFQHQHMLTIDTVDIQLELMPLLNKEIEVKRFLLDSPKVWLEQRSDTSNNWQDLQARSSAAPNTSLSSQPATQQQASSSSSSALSSPITLTADLLQLKHGQVTWSDAASGDVVISDIQLNIQDLQLTKPIQIALSAKLEQNPFELTAQVGPIGDFNTLDITKLPIRMQLKTNGFSLAPLSAWLPTLDETQAKQFGDLKTAKVNLDVSIEQHKDSAIASNGTVQVQLKDKLNMTWKVNAKAMKSVHIQSLKLALNDTQVIDISGNIKHLNQSPSYELRIETAKLQRIWLNHFIPALQTLYQHHPEPWQSIKLGALIAGDADILDIRDLQVQLNDEHIQASGNLALGKAPDIQLRITTNTLHLDPWIPQSEPKPEVQQTSSQETTVTPTPAEAVEPDLTFLKPWYLSLQLSAKRIDAIGLQLDNLRLTLSAEKGVLRLNPLKFEISGGRVSENFTLYANTYPATWKESMKLSGVSVQPILKAVADFEKLSGTAELSTSLSGKGLLPSSITQSLNGNGHFVFEDGQFEGVDIAKEVRKFKKQDSPSQNTTDFAQMQGSFRVNKGVLSNNDLYMASPLFRLTGKGKLYLDPLKLDYHVRPRLIESLAGQGGSRIDRGIEVPLHISGPLDDIQVSVEMDKDALINSAAAINNAAGKPIGGVGGKVLDQGFIKTRDEQIAKAKAEAKRKADAKIAAEKARLEAAAKKKAEEKLKDMFKGFGF
ncbi:MAG: AsmA family protein [Ghiorsea sp.]|nr:AsmA family protein [Ghiorsea sp.]